MSGGSHPECRNNFFRRTIIEVAEQLTNRKFTLVDVKAAEYPFLPKARQVAKRTRKLEAAADYVRTVKELYAKHISMRHCLPKGFISWYIVDSMSRAVAAHLGFDVVL